MTAKLPPPEGYPDSQPYAEVEVLDIMSEQEITDEIAISSELAHHIDEALLTGRREGFIEGLHVGKTMILSMLRECLVICDVSEEEALNVIKFIAHRAGINNVMK